MKRGIVAVVSDIHAGHNFGLSNPDTLVKDTDGVGVAVSKVKGFGEWNRYLWHDVYLPGVSQIVDLAGRSPIYLVVNGDLTQGNQHGDQLLSTRMSDQIIMAADCIKPFVQVKNVKAVRLVSGTQSHIFGESSSTELVANMLGREFPKKDILSTDHTIAKIFGVTVDYAHHGPSVGSRTWTTGNAARSYAKDIMLQDVLHGETPPDLIVRSHYHQYHREIVTLIAGDREYITQMVVTPSMCLLGDYGRQAMRSIARVVNGLVAFEIVNSRIVKVHRFIKVVDMRRREIYDYR